MGSKSSNGGSTNANLSSSGNDSGLFKRSISRANSGFLSSTMAEPCISCTTFNILAPIYKRLDQQVCLSLSVLCVIFLFGFLLNLNCNGTESKYS